MEDATCRRARGYVVLRLGADVSEGTIRKFLMLLWINGLPRMLYHIAWNAFETVAGEPEECEFFQQKWGKAFQISETMSNFLYDIYTTSFMNERKTKYLS